MIFKEINILSHLRVFLVAGLFIFLFMSCREDYYGFENRGNVPDDALNFSGYIKDGKITGTRDLTQEPVPVNSFSYDINFYIYMTCDIKNVKKLETYRVPEGYQGQLSVKEGGERLNWVDVESNHSFWSWTIPWAEKDEEIVEPDPEPDTDPTEPDPTDPETHLDEPDGGNNPSGEDKEYIPSTDALKFKLQDTDIQTYNDRSSWKNGRVLERFVGTKAGPYNYKENGRDVPLQFRHLVSRIVIDSIVLTDAYGADHKDLQGDIMFINMPDEFIFHPVPENGGAPYVETVQSSANKNKALKFALTNKSMDEFTDTLYICPEVDFREVEYKIAIKEGIYSYDDRGEYWGSLANLPFEREPGTDYDNVNGGDDYILHAGEEMHLSLFLREFGGGGNSIIIQPWQDGAQTESVHHPHPGIYGTAEGRAMSGIGIDPSANPNDYRDKWNDQYQISGDGSTKDDPEYGYDPENPDVRNPFHDLDYGIFNIYGDIDMTSYSFYVGGGYIYNGNGYTVTLKEVATAPGMMYLGNMRDIYIRMERVEKDADGNTQYYNIYIDPNGRICIPDENGNYYPSGLQMDGEYIRYNINMENLMNPDITPKNWSSTANGGSRSWKRDTYIKDLPAYFDPEEKSEETEETEETEEPEEPED